MATKITIRHKDSGMVKDAALGFSWTYFFFGIFVPLFRGEVKVAVLQGILGVFTFGVSHWVFMFIYNKQHLTRMVLDGWEFADTNAKNTWAKHKLLIGEIK